MAIVRVCGQETLRGLSVFENEIFRRSELADQWLAARVGNQSLTFSSLIRIKRRAIESQIEMEAAIVFGPDAAVDVRPNIQVGNFLVLGVQLDGNANTRAKS